MKSNLTVSEAEIYREGFNAAFKLLSEYIEKGVDMDTARANAAKIMNLKNDGSQNRFLPPKKKEVSKKR